MLSQAHQVVQLPFLTGQIQDYYFEKYSCNSDKCLICLVGIFTSEQLFGSCSGDFYSFKDYFSTLIVELEVILPFFAFTTILLNLGQEYQLRACRLRKNS